MKIWLFVGILIDDVVECKYREYRQQWDTHHKVKSSKKRRHRTSLSQPSVCILHHHIPTHNTLLNWQVTTPSINTLHDFDKEGGMSYLKTIESVTKTIQCGVYIEAQICKILQSIEAWLKSSSRFMFINWRIHARVMGREMPESVFLCTFRMSSYAMIFTFMQ